MRIFTFKAWHHSVYLSPQVQDVLSSLDGEQLELLKKELIEIKEIFEARKEEEAEEEMEETGSGGNGELYSQIRSFSPLCESWAPIGQIQIHTWDVIVSQIMSDEKIVIYTRSAFLIISSSAAVSTHLQLPLESTWPHKAKLSDGWIFLKCSGSNIYSLACGIYDFWPWKLHFPVFSAKATARQNTNRTSPSGEITIYWRRKDTVLNTFPKYNSILLASFASLLAY